MQIPVQQALRALSRPLLPDLPAVDLPEGRWLELRRRGRTWLTDVPGPTPDAPTIVLLHAVGCTGQLTWFPSIPHLAERYRVITFDQRWHGRGITSERFLVSDCADDVAAVVDELGLDRPLIAGYSMGSVVAQRVWRQHPDTVGGLILAASTDHFRTNGRERVFHAGMELGMGLTATLSRSARGQAGQRGHRRGARRRQLRHRSLGDEPVALEQPVGDRPGRGVPRPPPLHAVAVEHRRADRGRRHHPDRVLPPDRQRDLAALIPGATVHEAACGHAGCVLEHRAFVPALLEAAHATTARMRDRQVART